MKKAFLLCILLIGLGLTFTACSNNSQQKAEQLASDETYTCTMHNEVMSDHPGKCPKCNMNLVKQKMTEEQKKMKAEGTFVKPKE
jgi:membrane fusion protein, copper/silver efflux system